MNFIGIKKLFKTSIIAIATASMAVLMLISPVDLMKVKANSSITFSFSDDVTHLSAVKIKLSDGTENTIAPLEHKGGVDINITVPTGDRSDFYLYDYDPIAETASFSFSQVSGISTGSFTEGNKSIHIDKTCYLVFITCDSSGNKNGGVFLPLIIDPSDDNKSSGGCTPLTPEELYQIQLDKDFPAGNGYVGYGENSCFVEAGKDGDTINAWKAGTKVASFAVKDASETVVKSKCLGQKKVGDKYYISISAFSKAGGLHIVISDTDKAALKAKGISGVMLDGTKVLVEF